MWDGKDESGRNCRPGLYIFQAIIGNNRYNGTFVFSEIVSRWLVVIPAKVEDARQSAGIHNDANIFLR